jgi:hypothetical protein
LLVEAVHFFAMFSPKHPVLFGCPAELPLVRGDAKVTLPVVPKQG